MWPSQGRGHYGVEALPVWSTGSALPHAAQQRAGGELDAHLGGIHEQTPGSRRLSAAFLRSHVSKHAAGARASSTSPLVDLFVGLDNAELNVPAQLATVAERARKIAVFALVGGTQIAWLGILGYFAYGFLMSYAYPGVGRERRMVTTTAATPFNRRTGRAHRLVSPPSP
jgi:hypothetical protein